MMTKSKINSLQLAMLIFYLGKASFLGIGFSNIEELAHQDSWISNILGAIIGFIPMLLYMYIANHHPNLNIIQLNKKIFGNILGFIINLIIVFIVFTLGVSALSNLARFIQVNYLIFTPNLVIAGVFLAISCVAAIRGIEVITRCGTVLFAIVILSFFPIIFALAPYIEFSNLKPILESGYMRVLEGGLMHTAINVAPVFLILIIPKNQIIDKKNYNKMNMLWYIIVNIAIFIIFFWTISILGHKLASLYDYPTYSVLKKISFMDFVERIENNAILHWLFDYFFILAMVLYFIKEFFTTTFQIKKSMWSTIIIIITAILLIIFPSYIFEQHADLRLNFFRLFGHIMGISVFSITIIIFIRLLFIKRQPSD